MEIKLIPISDIKPYKKNAKIHTKEQIEKIKRSIAEFDNNDPIAVWGEENIIVEGHGRYEALKQLGETVIPCIRLDHLTDEQRRAYTLVHNKLTMETDFDIETLPEELDDIFNIDMEDFGFEIPDIFEQEIQQKINAEETQRRVENILNLEYGQFDGAGKYDIPILQPVYDLPEIKEWIGFNYVLSDTEPEEKAVHFFVDDYQFIRLWNNPDRYVDKLKRYACVATPDFSPYGDMPLAAQIFNIYRKNWIGAFLQANGVTVIPTVRASTDERSLDFYLDGFPEKSIVLISNMWTKDEDGRKAFLKEYETMVSKLRPKKIFVYGSQMDELKENIEYIETFTAKRWYNKNG